MRTKISKQAGDAVVTQEHGYGQTDFLRWERILGSAFPTLRQPLCLVLKGTLLSMIPYAITQGRSVLAVLSSLAFGFSLLLPLVAMRLELPKESDLFVTVLLSLHVVLGVGGELYERAPYFDNGLHLVGTILISSLIFKVVMARTATLIPSPTPS
ncbi:MAG: hypothetical protein R3B95_12185 [Nitrospirales bacterium]|nr:hypothetical protein [Nitrospirales bacterium]